MGRRVGEEDSENGWGGGRKEEWGGGVGRRDGEGSDRRMGRRGREGGAGQW